MVKSQVGNSKKILLIYFSLSSQTKNLVHSLMEGLREHQIEIIEERLEPASTLRFPIGSIPQTLLMMVCTFFRQRVPIQPLSEKCFAAYDLIILAGPTWSYNPSGPVLSLLDRDGRQLFQGKTVLPLISCRGYWRMHWWTLKKRLARTGATIANLMIFAHPNPEPWRTVGVFLKLAGRIPEKGSWISKYYSKYGHSRDQLMEAKRFGEMIGEALAQHRDVSTLNFRTTIALP